MKRRCIGLFFCILITFCGAEEPLFDVKILPSIADKELDFWFYTPPDTSPEIPVVRKVYPNQTFMLLIICRVHPVDVQTQANICYDMKLIGPDAKVIVDEKNSPYYEGPILNNKLILANDHVLEMSFEASDKAGTYTLEMVFHETVSKRDFSTSAEIELVEFNELESFKSDEEFSDLTMSYFRHPDPIRSFSGILYQVQLSSEWTKENGMLMAFYRRIFLDNPFLWEYYAELYKTVSEMDKRKMLLIAAVIPTGKEKERFLESVQGEMKSFYAAADEIVIPDTDKEITTAEQLDILWAEFLASGTYTPVKRIVSALALKEHEAILDQIKNEEITEITEEVEKQMMLGIVFQAAEWSLISNCMQMQRVHQYCRMLYEYDPTLAPEVKAPLGVVLAAVDIKKHEEAAAEQMKSQEL